MNQGAIWRAIQEPLDIQIYDPRTFPAASPGAIQRLTRRLARSIPIGVLVKVQFQTRLKVVLDHRLRNAVSHRWNSQRTNAAIGFGYLHPPHGCRM